MRALLDVGVLLALFDSGHIAHHRSRVWWQANMSHGWASCPLTENGYVRIVSQPRYVRPTPLVDAVELLRLWAVPPRHVFWPDDLTLLDQARIDHARLLGPRQIKDVYLLALAVKNGGRLATLDRGISLGAVKGARLEHLAVIA